MANESKILWGTLTDITSPGLESLGANNWWQSGLIADTGPTNEFVRISYEIIFASGLVAGDYLWFRLLKGDGGSPEIWSGGIGVTEGQITVAADKAAVQQTPAAQWTHYWDTDHGTTFKGSRDIGIPGERWQLLISGRGRALSTGNIIRYRYGTTQLQP